MFDDHLFHALTPVAPPLVRWRAKFKSRCWISDRIVQIWALLRVSEAENAPTYPQSTRIGIRIVEFVFVSFGSSELRILANPIRKNVLVIIRNVGRAARVLRICGFSKRSTK